MLRSLFARLTADRDRGAALFARVVAEARQPHWYVEGEVPDTVDGRFAMLATVTALVLARLQNIPDGPEASAALTERFIESIDAELRQMGVSDPVLGKQVRKLVSALELRVQLFADAADEGELRDAVLRSAYRDKPSSEAAVEHTLARVAALRETLRVASDEQIKEGSWA